MSSFSFEVVQTDGTTEARCGTLKTRAGSASTPAFMPVATAAAMKALDIDQVVQTGSEVILCNTYHLAVRPGDDVIRELGGLHRFMGWDRTILTDSGGFQVFSLAGMTRVDKDGVTFRNHVDGQHLRLTPERATKIQLNLGSDILMAFDECLPADASHGTVAASLHERTIPWETRCLACHPRDGRAMFGINQGGLFEDLRVEHAQRLAEEDWDGLAIGGLSVGESSEDYARILKTTTVHLPQSKPRYLMGVGSPPELLVAMEAGVDMFDCVLPTRNARNGQALTFDGPVRIKNSAHRCDPGVLEEGCPCSTCARGFSRAYLRHLILSGEILGATLMTAHNLTFMQRFMAQARRSIAKKQFPEFKLEFLERWGSKPSR